MAKRHHAKEDHQHHSHTHHHHHHDEHGHESRFSAHGSLSITAVITGILFLAELIGGYYTQSLALLSDAGHMFVDLGALLLSLLAMWLGRKRADRVHTFGYRRAEVIAAFVNCISLWAVMIMIFIEAFERLHTPRLIHVNGMLIIAVLGLAANILGMFFLHGHHHHNVNIKSSYLHLLSDTMGSVATIIAGLIMHYTGRTEADAIASFMIGGLTLYSSWDLIKETLRILMESAPEGIDTVAIREALEKHPGISQIHDLHVWQITQKNIALMVHGVLKPNANYGKTLKELTAVIHDGFHIHHSTIQLEESGGCETECG